MGTALQPTGGKIFKRVFFSVGGAVLVWGLWSTLSLADALGAFHEPPLRLEQSGPSVIVHVERLGMYYCQVGRILVQESDSGKTVYEAVTKGDTPIIFNFKLAAGSNPTEIKTEFRGTYSVVQPRSDRYFWLQRGVRYRITVWGDSWTFRRASFVL